MKALKFLALIFVLLGAVMAFTAHRQIVEKDDSARSREQTLLKWRSDPVHKKAVDLCDKNSAWATDECDAISSNQVMLGMNKEQVVTAWGKPKQVNKTLTEKLDREQWVYGQGQYLYFYDGKLKSMQTPGK